MVSAHLLLSGINISTLSINGVIGSLLFMRTLSVFTGGHPAYSVTYARPIDRLNALNTARAFVIALESHIQAFLASPCKEDPLGISIKVVVIWGCQFVTFKVLSSLHVSAVGLFGKNFVVDVSFVPLPRPLPIR